VLVEEAADGGLQIDDPFEHAALEPPLGERGEEALNSIEPRRRRRREMEVKARMPRQPGAHLRVLVRGVVVNEATIGFVRFAVFLPKSVSGAVEIASITKHAGFCWIQRKSFYPAGPDRSD